MKLALVTPQSDPPRWTTRTPAMGLPFKRREHGEDDAVIMNPALKAWLERKPIAADRRRPVDIEPSRKRTWL